MAPHSSTLAWKISWTEEPGRLQSMGSLREDGVEDMHVSISPHYKGYGNIWLRIYDENQLVATQKGKTYTIPLKITLTGSDGLSKEPVVNLKVTLKR